MKQQIVNIVNEMLSMDSHSSRLIADNGIMIKLPSFFKQEFNFFYDGQYIYFEYKSMSQVIRSFYVQLKDMNIIVDYLIRCRDSFKELLYNETTRLSEYK